MFQDYHVILLVTDTRSEVLVYDLDSELPFPCSLNQYAAQAFRSDLDIRPEYHRSDTRCSHWSFGHWSLVLTQCLSVLTGSYVLFLLTTSC